MGFFFQGSGGLTEASAWRAARPSPSVTGVASEAQSDSLGDMWAGQARAIKRALFLPHGLNIGTSPGRGILWAVLACNPAARMEGRGRVRDLNPSWYPDQQEGSGTSLLSGSSRRLLGSARYNPSGLWFLSNPQTILYAFSSYRATPGQTYSPLS